MWFNWTLRQCLLDLLFADIKRNRPIPSAGNMASLAPKLNRFNVKNYFDKLRELLIKLDIMDKPERICSVDEKRCRLHLN
jgi:hypothetical protein